MKVSSYTPKAPRQIRIRLTTDQASALAAIVGEVITDSASPLYGLYGKILDVLLEDERYRYYLHNEEGKLYLKERST